MLSEQRQIIGKAKATMADPEAAIENGVHSRTGASSSSLGQSDPKQASQHASASNFGEKDHHELGLEDIIARLFHHIVEIMERDMKSYFDHLDTRSFFRRLVRAIIPSPRYDDLLTKPDLYGPLVLTFTLSSCLHFAFKKADPAPLDRHLGTSLLLCFGSLVIGALLLDVAWQYSAAMAKQTPAKYGLDRAFSVVGYSFLGPSIVILFYGRITPFLYIPIALMFAFGSAMSFGTAAFKASQSQSHALGAACALLHLIWLYNLRGVLDKFEAVVDVTAG